MALLNKFSTSSNWVDYEPWKYVWIIFGNFLKNLFLVYIPFIDLYINWALKFLPLPGFPIMIKGILAIADKKNKNTFSFNKVF